MLKVFIILILVIFNVIISYFFGSGVDLAEQKEAIGSLQTISAVIFGVMGAWIAIVYPDSLSQILKWSNKEVDKDVEAVKKILLPIKYATTVLLYSLMFNWLAPVFRQIILLQQNKDIALTISFFFIGCCYLSLLVALVFSFAPIDRVENRINKKKGLRDALIKKRGMAQESNNKE